MLNNFEDVNQILNGKYGLKYKSDDIDGLRQMCLANKNKSLQQFRDVI
jgi:hypothetical protein